MQLNEKRLSVNVRLIASTNRDPSEAVRARIAGTESGSASLQMSPKTCAKGIARRSTLRPVTPCQTRQPVSFPSTKSASAQFQDFFRLDIFDTHSFRILPNRNPIGADLRERHPSERRQQAHLFAIDQIVELDRERTQRFASNRDNLVRIIFE